MGCNPSNHIKLINAELEEIIPTLMGDSYDRIRAEHNSSNFAA